MYFEILAGWIEGIANDRIADGFVFEFDTVVTLEHGFRPEERHWTKE